MLVLISAVACNKVTPTSHFGHCHVIYIFQLWSFKKTSETMNFLVQSSVVKHIDFSLHIITEISETLLQDTQYQLCFLRVDTQTASLNSFVSFSFAPDEYCWSRIVICSR